MQETLIKVKHLEKFLQKHGEDPFIFQTISKMLIYKINKYNEEINKLDKELKKFEHTYKKISSIFFKEFNEGKLGDDINFVEWASLYQMRKHLFEKKIELEGIK